MAEIDRRLHERHDVWLPFEIQGRGGDRYHNDFIENLSVTGAYVRTLEPMPQSTRLKIAILAPKSRRAHTFDAEVVRVIEPEQAAASGMPPGMGIAFLDIGQGDPRPRVVEILQELQALTADAQRAAKAAAEPAPEATPAPTAEKPPLDDKMKEQLALLDKAVVSARKQNYYELLGVDPAAATAGVVKKAYHRRSKEFHPDRFHRVRTRQGSGETPEEARKRESIDAKVEELYGHLTKAYETLKDAAKRETYDRTIGVRVSLEFRRAAAKSRMDEALKQLSRNRLFAATVGLKVALSLDPGNPDAQRKLDEIERQRKFFTT